MNDERADGEVVGALASEIDSQSAADASDDGWPMRRLMGGRLVPDFTRVPESRWRAAMISIPVHLRMAAIQGLPLPLDELGRLCALAMDELPPAPTDMARAELLKGPRYLPTPRRERRRRADRQVNFRLDLDEFLDLATVAKALGWTPSGLAAEIVRNGVQRMLAEINRPAS